MSVVTKVITQSAAGRGERLYPARYSRVYWVLTRLRQEMEAIRDSRMRSFSVRRLVDFGCGNMPYRPIFEPFVQEYLGCDLPGNEAAELLLSDEHQIPLEDASVPVVLSNQVLEHVEDVPLYLLECRRVLEPKGVLVLSTHGVWRYHPDPMDLWRWTSAGLQRELTTAGFEVVRFVGILGPEATALQLLQDHVLPSIPRLLKQLYTWHMQRRVQRADARCSDSMRNADACVYVAVAMKN